MESVLFELLSRLLKGIALTASIGLSDAIELKTNPTVHREHNCPDIMQKSWNDYTYADAFMSGWLCAWWLVIPALMIVPTNITLVMWLCVFNVLVPFIVWPYQHKISDLGHLVLYLVNPVGIIASTMSLRIGDHNKAL